MSHAAAASSAPVDRVLEGARVGPLQIKVALLCALVAMLDGFDTQAVAFVAPVLAEVWNVGPERFGIIFAAGLIGIMVGQLTLGPLSDRFGRRPVIIACTLAFGVCSLATITAENWIMLLALRFITGIGLGGATPNVIALTCEYAPPRTRATMITTMFAGFPLGAALGGYVSSLIIPAFGWTSVFIMGGILPLLLLVVLIAWLPESPYFLANSGRDPARLKAILQRINPHAPAPLEVAAHDATTTAPASKPIASLFTEGRTGMTLLLWFAYFNSLLMVYFLMSWMPAIAKQGGLALDTAIISAVFLNLGGAIGGILLGRISDKFGAFRTLAFGFAIAGVSLIAIGQMSSNPAVLMPLVFLAGLCTIGGQTAMNAAATTLYPAYMRATALGAALAVGRIGSIVGPTVGGFLLATGWPVSTVFLVVALPAFVTVITVTALVRLGR